MRKNIFSIIVIIGLSVVNVVNAQGVIPHNQLQSVIPQSPTAASLGKYGEMPVGAYTGVPSISVPIYELNTGKLSLPLSISYHAAGVKVEEMASWVGLGWSLNAGGVITRQVRGLPDEAGEGFLSRYIDLRKYVNNQMSQEEKDYYLEQVNSGIWDAQPDLFTYNVGGLSGIFFYDTTGNVLSKPLSKVQFSGGSTWEIVDNSGSRYAFNAVETTNSESINNGTLSSNPSGNIKTSWYLSKINNALNTDSIVFEYESTYYTFYTLTGQTKYYLLTNDDCSAKDMNTYTSTNTITGQRLTRIAFTNGEILFKKKSSEREDLPDDYALDTIIIKNNSNTFYKKIIFHQHYSIAENPPQQNYSEYYRLCLDSISIADINTSTAMRYKFEYNSPEFLPQRMSYSQDHWGYNNGAQNGTTFFPTTTLPTAFGSSVTINGANRAPSSNNSKYGMLTKMVYPTGGYTIFDYENNYALSPENTYTIENRGYVSLGSQVNGPTYYETDTFTIGACDTALNEVPATVYLSTAACGGGQQMLGCPLVNLVGTNSSYSAPIVSSGTITIPPGDYKITADLFDVTDEELYNSFYIDMYWEKCNPVVVGSVTYYNTMVGGHRIKSIIDYDERNNIANSRYYNYNLPGTSTPSGTLLCFPNYVGTFQEERNYTIPGTSQTYFWSCSYFTINSASNYPLLTTQGSSVGYSYVKEMRGLNGADGITEFTYTSPQDFPDVVDQSFPFPPSDNFEWRRGLLLKERKSKAVVSGGNITFFPIEETKKVYTESLADSVRGLKTGLNIFFTYQSNTAFISAATYLTSTGWVALTTDTVRGYDQNDTLKYTTNITSYEHSSNNLQPNKTTSTINLGKKQIVRIKYPLDYTIASGSSVSENLGLKYLQDNNIINTPVEKYLIQKDASGNEYVIAGTIITFKPGKPVPDKLYGLELSSPVAINSFTTSSLDGSGNLVKDSRYKEQVNFSKYDVSGNLSEQYKTNNIKQSYIWNYNLSFPAAEVMNADSSSIAYSSFEGENKGNWSYSATPVTDATSPTGSKCYSLNWNNITKTGLTSATYVVSYWSKSGSPFTVNGSSTPTRTGKTINGWTYYEHEITSTSVTISGNNYIDEVRLYPKGALMTTYAYIPILGLTSQCDADNRITYYEYDGLGRLKLIKDQDKNIVKVFDYQFRVSQNQ